MMEYNDYIADENIKVLREKMYRKAKAWIC